jgi:hypothetical protein
LEEDLKVATTAASREDYEESKRLVEVNWQLTTAKQALEALKAAHGELVSDCNDARASLLQDLLEEIFTDPYLGAAELSHSQLLGQASEGKEGEAAVARRAKKGLEGKKGASDPAKYQFVKIAELVRLRLEKKDRECQRLVDTGGGRSSSSVHASIAPGLISAARSRLPVTAGGGDESLDAVATVGRLEGELEAMAARNGRLEQRCSSLEGQLKGAVGSADDLIVLKSKALQLLVNKHLFRCSVHERRA